MTSVKRVEDLPHFHVGATNQLETRTNGYADFEFHGTLDRIDGVYEAHRIGRDWATRSERAQAVREMSPPRRPNS